MSTVVLASTGKGSEGITGKMAVCSSRIYPANIKKADGSIVYMHAEVMGYGLNAAGICRLYFYCDGVLKSEQEVLLNYNNGIQKKSRSYMFTNNNYSSFQITASFDNERPGYSHFVPFFVYTEVIG
ncbi:hypothetical protein [Clostridium sp.]|uniref:hypothetical protein n=1 Tax=Clostridium sp. TaxID=1506 RepID=UPI001A397B99|nr:hypothetical protein [Clostridium sp.]MBK5234054.1 hypothetical protein [Clostridium sp.]